MKGGGAGGQLVSVVVPVYNEAENIGACLRGLSVALKDTPHEILICYDFDEDTTLGAIAAMEDCPATVRLVKNDLGRGAAYAIQAGFQAAQGDVVVTTMADLSDPPEVIPAMAAKVRSGAAVVSGSRYMKGGSQEGGPFLKRTFSRIAGLSLYYLAGVGTRDSTNSFRAYSRRFLEGVKVESTQGFEVGLELTVKAHLKGLKVDEVPTAWRDRSAGQSRFRMWRWLPRYLKWYWMAMRRPLKWAVVFLLSFAWALILFVPWDPFVSLAPLDPSWVMGLNEALAAGKRFGEDIVFTMGPAGFVYGKLYYPETFGSLLVIWTVLAGSMTAILYGIARAWTGGAFLSLVAIAAVMFFAAFVPSYSSADAFAVVFAVAFMVWHWAGDREKPLAPELVWVTVLAVLSLVKFTFAVFCVIAIMTVAVGELLRARWRTALVTPALYAVMFVALWLAAGQRFGDLPAFWRRSYVVAVGYNDAMSRTWVSPCGAVREIGTYLCWAAFVVAMLVRSTRGGVRPLVAAARAAGMAALLFILFKTAFVRHDRHGIIAAFCIPAITVLLLPVVLPANRRVDKVILCVACIVALCAPVQAIFVRQNYLVPHVKDTPERIASRVAAAGRLLLRGSADLDRSYENACKATRRENPLPPLNGTVDIYPYHQGVVIGYGMDYDPRPVFQSYSAYLPELAELNAAHLRGAKAPDTLLFSIRPFKGRLAAMDDGLSWPELFTKYDLKSIAGRFLVFERAKEARTFSFVEIANLTAVFDSWVQLPPGAAGAPLWAKVAVRPTRFARIAAFLYKGPYLSMTVRTAGGEEKTYRLVTAIAANGFLLSPVVEDTSAFARLAAGDMDSLAGSAVKALKFSAVEGCADLYYEPDIPIDLFRLDYPAQAAAAGKGLDAVQVRSAEQGGEDSAINPMSGE